MFKLAEKHTVKWPVTIRKPIDGGKVENNKIEVEFEILATDVFEQANKEGDFLDRVLIAINTPIFQGETELAFEAAKKSLLRISYARTALTEAYFTASSGREAQQKN